MSADNAGDHIPKRDLSRHPAERPHHTEKAPEAAEQRIENPDEAKFNGAEIAESFAEHVRFVDAAENIEKVYQEMCTLSREAQVEYGLIETWDGQLQMISGGPNRIKFFEITPKRVIAHTHPKGGALPSKDDISAIRELGQESSIVIDAITGEQRVFNLRDYRSGQ